MSFFSQIMPLSVGLLAGPLLALAGSRPEPGALVLIIVPPWRSAAAVVEQAGGAPVGPVEAPFGALAASDNLEFITNLRQAGAWLAVGGGIIDHFCRGNQ